MKAKVTYEHGLPIYDKRNCFGEVVEVIGHGEEFDVVEEVDGWLHVKDKGWCEAGHAEVVDAATSWNDLADKPFGKERVETETVLFDREGLPFEYRANGYYLAMNVNSTFGRLVEGETYTVIWDGVEYKNLVPFHDEYGDIYIGSTFDAYTDEKPFTIGNYELNGTVMLSAYTLSEGETHSIIIIGPEFKFNKLDTGFLPWLIIENGWDYEIDDARCYANMTYEEASELLRNGLLMGGHLYDSENEEIRQFIRIDKDSEKINCRYLVDDSGNQAYVAFFEDGNIENRVGPE